MTYYGTTGEIILVLALIFIATVWYKQVTSHSVIKGLVIASLATIAITASFGAIRFAGYEHVITIHDQLSWISKHIAMLIYASATAFLVIAGKARIAILVVLIIGIAQPFGAMTADVALFICLLSFTWFSKQKLISSLSLLCLLLVPISVLLPITVDAQMGVFHLMLAAHFVLMALCLKKVTDKSI